MDDSPHYSKEYFYSLMKELDEEMRWDNVPVHARAIQAVIRFGKKMNRKIMLAPPDEMSKCIYKWFESRYGKKLLVDFSPGSIVLLIKGDAYKIKLPLIFGRFLIVADDKSYCSNPVLQKYSFSTRESSPPAVFNPLYIIEGMTPMLASSLSWDELHEISNYTSWGFECYEAINSLKGSRLIKSAFGDLSDAVEKIFAKVSQYGQSKWASLQAAEKFIKAYIRSKGQKPHRDHHNLRKYIEETYYLGMEPFIDSNYIDRIQISAGARYGDVEVSLKEAVDAHHAALSICAGVALILNRK